MEVSRPADSFHFTRPEVVKVFVAVLPWCSGVAALLPPATHDSDTSDLGAMAVLPS